MAKKYMTHTEDTCMDIYKAREQLCADRTTVENNFIIYVTVTRVTK